MKRCSLPASLYRLVYCSCNLIARSSADVDAEQEIRSILTTARRRNKADNVTGALLFTASGFAQVLEGPREVVERTFERIAADKRHNDVTVLSFTPFDHRSFPDWSMGFCGQQSAGANDPVASFFAETKLSGPRAATGSDVLRLLEKVVQREDEWISA